MHTATDTLLQEIEAYCQRVGIAESTFGRHAINDGKLCARLRSGKSVTLTTAERVTEFIQRNSRRLIRALECHPYNVWQMKFE